MSVIDLENLLQAVSEDLPCGEDLEYDAEFMALEQEIEGSAEQQMGDAVIEAEEPNWKDIQQRSAALLARTRDLRLLLLQIRAAIRLDGFEALADGLNLIDSWVEQFWEHLYPLLDPDDDSDPTERVNILMTFCDFDAMLQPVTQIPLVDSKVLGKFNLQQIRASESDDPPEDAPDTATINAAFTDAELNALLEVHTHLQRCSDSLHHLEENVTDLVGITNAPNFSPLNELINEIQTILTDQISLKGGFEAESETDSEADGTEQVDSGKALQGDIRNSQDVIRAIEKICDYYKKNEPSSPVPILLERAKRLVNMDFLSIVKDLASEGVSQVENFVGYQEEEDEY